MTVTILIVDVVMPGLTADGKRGRAMRLINLYVPIYLLYVDDLNNTI